ncbi:choline BCCT transporter BetT [Oceanimonas doudoroffii]|uniref:High-affinity choline transporter BetT n=1 Tax=Oceanimonas doudoroffii TaxID=84158 RepID=A0A233RGW0_9GAMM|nr:choline BCCT transporter BetT [Oceanimonas doudoroffii]OXY82627.1 high-affinity choline transporter BetT [Oceanimonas doudoroffii]
MTQQVSDSRPGGRLNTAVFHGSVAGILIFLIYAIAFTDHATAFFNAGLDWIGQTFGWYYMLAIVVYLVFVLAVGASRFGKIRLGPDHSRPEFSLLSWSAMLFAAGLGGAILFFVVSEPLTHYLNPPVGIGGGAEAHRRAIVQTFMHWGISGWGVYVLMGLALAYFSYRHRLPLAIRSTLYPLLGKRIYGPVGDAVDITAVLATVFGIATALGIGVMQMNYGLSYLFDVPEGLTAQVLLIALVVTLATLSVVSGVDKGIRRLSEFNLLMVAAVVLFVLLQGDTLMLLNALVMNVGDYIAALTGKSFETYAYNSEAQGWFSGWTVFFWSWWIAWAPFIGLFLARISRGRTIREFVAGALFIPLIFVMVMMSVFGNSGINLVEQGLVVLGEQAVNMPQASIYTFLEQLPWVGLTASLVTLLSIIFFVTSADSGALVLSNFTYILRDVNHDAPVRLRIFWSVLIGLITLALLMAGGLRTLQSAVVISALPFSAVIFLVIFGLYRSLRIETGKLEARQQAVTGNGAALDWRERLDRTLDGATHDRAEATIRHAIRPALTELVEELTSRGQQASLTERETGEAQLPCPMLRVDFEGAPSFSYEIRTRRMQPPSFLPADDDYYLRLDVHLADGSVGQDLNGYTRLQVVHDVLNEFQQHLSFLTEAGLAGHLGAIPDHEMERELLTATRSATGHDTTGEHQEQPV